MKLKKHIKENIFLYVYFGLIGLFLIGIMFIKIYYPQVFYYDSGWRFQR